MSECLDHCGTIYIMLILNTNVMFTFITHEFCPSCTTPDVTQTSHVVTINTVSTISYTGLTAFDTKPSYDTFCAHAHTHTKEQIKQIKTYRIMLNKIFSMWLNILNSLDVVKHIKFFSMWLNIFKMTKKQNLLTKWHVSMYYMWSYFYCNIFHSTLVYTKNTFRFVCDTCCTYNKWGKDSHNCYRRD